MVRAFCVLGLLTAVLGTESTHAQTRDTVILRSGNPVIGEIEQLRRGNLDLDTDEMDVVSIDWDDIALVRSSGIFEVELTNGIEFVGSLATTDTAVLIVVGATSADTVPFRQVVRIGPIDQGFWARTKGFVDSGTRGSGGAST